MEKVSVKLIKLLTPPGVKSWQGYEVKSLKEIDSTFLPELYICLNIGDIILFGDFQG
mgnify:CR=1 FL=1